MTECQNYPGKRCLDPNPPCGGFSYGIESWDFCRRTNRKWLIAAIVFFTIMSIAAFNGWLK